MVIQSLGSTGYLILFYRPIAHSITLNKLSLAKTMQWLIQWLSSNITNNNGRTTKNAMVDWCNCLLIQWLADDTMVHWCIGWLMVEWLTDDAMVDWGNGWLMMQWFIDALVDWWCNGLLRQWLRSLPRQSDIFTFVQKCYRVIGPLFPPIVPSVWRKWCRTPHDALTLAPTATPTDRPGSLRDISQKEEATRS